MSKRLPRSLVAVALLVVLFNTTTSFACGPFTLDAFFVFTVHPTYPLERYARGELGVVQPSYARSYLYVAYRYLTDSPFSSTEQQVLTQFWKDRLNYTWDLGEQDWIKAWLAARQTVSGLTEAPKIEVYRSREKPNEYETYLNCQKDAFETAVSTLNERIKKYGADHSALRNWIEGQDQVFANCAEGQHLPAPAPATADALEKDDRAYQIAAANFYAGNFDEARKAFDRIAADASSPWQTAARYLVARTLIRKASLGPDDMKAESLSQAETTLKAILADKKLVTSRAASSRLLDLVRLRLHPSERLHELAHALLVKTPNNSLRQDLWDYTSLLDSLLETEDTERKAKARVEATGDDLTDWISTLQENSTEARDHALSLWQTTHASTWFIASLAKIDGRHPKAAELIEQAIHVAPTSAAFASASFHAVRLLMESGKIVEARSQIDQLLKNDRARFDLSTLNLLTAERMMLAGNLAEFLSYAPRVPAGLGWDDDGREVPAESSEVSDEMKNLLGKPLFDQDAANVLNRQLPLDLLKEAATSEVLPTRLRRDVAQATWIRAVILDDAGTADDLVPALKTLVPELSDSLDDFLSTSQPEAKKFTGLYTWLKFPGLEPIVDAGIGRETPLNKQDTYRDNWWCAASVSNSPADRQPDMSEPSSFTAGAIRFPLFLTEAQRARANKESATLGAFGATPNYLCRQVIQWATKNPSDPRVPEALHLAVSATRYGCTDQGTGRWSKAAFDLLHRKYGNTTWARKTPYWFKD
jgi:tetratricopeptide (TPR) repeat protein